MSFEEEQEIGHGKSKEEEGTNLRENFLKN